MSRRIVFGSSGLAISAPGDDVLTPIKPFHFNSNLATCPVVARSYASLVASTATVNINFDRTFSGVPLLSLVFSPTGLPSSQPLANRRLLYLLQGTLQGAFLVSRKGSNGSYMGMYINATPTGISLYQSAVNATDTIGFMTGIVIAVVYDYRETIS